MLLKAEELQKRLGISSRVYYQMLKEDKLPPSIKIGKRIRYPADMVDQWIKDNAK